MTDKPAVTSVPIHHLLAARWSSRAFDADAKITDDQVRALLEAARWAPSFGNTQPARFLLGRSGDETYQRILTTLTERNQDWARRAGMLLVGIAVTRNEKGDIPYAEYGVALAAQNLVLQAVAEGLAAHQMAGFDRDAVRQEFALPDDAVPIVAIAVGTRTDASVLGEQRKIDREQAARSRMPLEEMAFSEWGRPAL